MEEDISDHFTVYKYTDCKHLDYFDYTQDTQAVVLGVQHSLWSQSRTPHFQLERREVVWASSSSLHASWEFLFPVLGRDPRPLKLQLLFDVLLLTLLEERRVLVAGG